MSELKISKAVEAEFIAECRRRGFNPKKHLAIALKEWVRDSRKVATFNDEEKRHILASFMRGSTRYRVLEFIMNNNPTNSLELAEKFGRKGYSNITSVNQRIRSFGLTLECQKVHSDDPLNAKYHGIVFHWQLMRAH